MGMVFKFSIRQLLIFILFCSVLCASIEKIGYFDQRDSGGPFVGYVIPRGNWHLLEIFVLTQRMYTSKGTPDEVWFIGYYIKDRSYPIGIGWKNTGLYIQNIK